MPDVNTSSHALLTMISRCLSGHWSIDPSWLLQHADMVFRHENAGEQSAVWPKMQSSMMISDAGIYSAAGEGGTIGKGQALGVINVVGPIYKYGYNSSKNLIAYLNVMASDERVGGVKIIMDSPGGMVHGTREVYQAILNYPKPVLSVVDGYAASAGYYQIAGSKRIVAVQPNDQIGSIGTYQTMADWNTYFESFGLSLYEIYADASSQKNEESRQVFESKGKNTELAQKQITSYNNFFLADVKNGRGDKLTGKGQDPFKGRIFFTADSIENGLIDDQVNNIETLGLLADMVATNKQSTIQMSFFSDLKQLISKHEDNDSPNANTDAPEAASVEQLTAQVQTLTKQRDDATAAVSTLTKERDDAKASVVTLTKERDEANVLVATYGAQPGATPTTVSKTQDETPKAEGETKTTQEILDDLPSEKEAKAMGFR